MRCKSENWAYHLTKGLGNLSGTEDVNACACLTLTVNWRLSYFKPTTISPTFSLAPPPTTGA